MIPLAPWLLPVAVLVAASPKLARAQDDGRGGEPIVASIDPAKLAYDYLVDADLPQDDPANRKFKTLGAACEAAPAGTDTKRTVIGIRPNVYRLPGGERGASLRLTKDYVTLLGLTNNRRAVVLADDRGHAQGAADNGFLLDVRATGFTLRNVTLLNHCNVDYAYPGDPTKNLAKRSDVITQAVALQASGDKHVYENVALLSRLDTMFLGTTRSYFKDVYIEGTDDFIGGGQMSVWEDCTIAFPTGRGVMLAANVVFRRCTFRATGGLQFYKAEFGSGTGKPAALIDCVLPANSPRAPVAWVRGRAASRPSLRSFTYRVRDPSGKPAAIPDGTLDSDRFTYSIELTDDQAWAFNPWNLLRAVPGGAVDDWDPAGARETSEGSAAYRILLTGTPATVRTGGAEATITASVLPARVSDKMIRWSTESDLVTLRTAADGTVLATGRNTTEQPQYVPILATAANGLRATAHVLVETAYLDPPAITAAPTLDAPADGAIRVAYAVDLGGREDQSIVTWSLCDDAAGANPCDVAVQRGTEPMRMFVLPPGAVGKFVRASVQPKHRVSEPGPPASVVSSAPIAPADVRSRDVSPNFRDFVTTPNADFVGGLWTVVGKWTVEPGERFENGYGIRAGSVGASLLYPRDEPCGDMTVDLVLTPEKTDGQGFGGPGSPADDARAQKSDVFIKYDPRTRNGYSLRFWRTTQSAQQCMFQLYKIENGVGSPLNDQRVLSGVFKPTTRMTLKVVGDRLTVSASNDADHETLSLEGTIVPNPFGGAGVYWAGSVPRGNSNTYSRIAVTYP